MGERDFPWAFLFQPCSDPAVFVVHSGVGPWTEPTPPPPPPPDECYCTILPADGVVAYAEPCRPCRERVVADAESFLV